MYFGTINYNDPNSDIEIIISEKETIIKSFKGSDPLIVWFEFKKWFYEECQQRISWSSTIDHWFMDSEYKEEYFNLETFEFVDWRKIEMWDVAEKYPSCVVNQEMKNFNDLKEYYKVKKGLND